MTDEEKLLAKLRKIEALYAGAGTTGERDAARTAIVSRVIAAAIFDGDDDVQEMRAIKNS